METELDKIVYTDEEFKQFVSDNLLCLSENCVIELLGDDLQSKEKVKRESKRAGYDADSEEDEEGKKSKKRNALKRSPRRKLKKKIIEAVDVLDSESDDDEVVEKDSKATAPIFIPKKKIVSLPPLPAPPPAPPYSSDPSNSKQSFLSSWSSKTPSHISQKAFGSQSSQLSSSPSPSPSPRFTTTNTNIAITSSSPHRPARSWGGESNGTRVQQPHQHQQRPSQPSPYHSQTQTQYTHLQTERAPSQRSWNTSTQGQGGYDRDRYQQRRSPERERGYERTIGWNGRPAPTMEEPRESQEFSMLQQRAVRSVSSVYPQPPQPSSSHHPVAPPAQNSSWYPGQAPSYSSIPPPALVAPSPPTSWRPQLVAPVFVPPPVPVHSASPLHDTPPHQAEYSDASASDSDEGTQFLARPPPAEIARRKALKEEIWAILKRRILHHIEKGGRKMENEVDFARFRSLARRLTLNVFKGEEKSSRESITEEARSKMKRYVDSYFKKKPFWSD